ncbi:hypothetical protein OG2516_18250 [Oceanicola granulosus HTCC2516]|uniref:Sulfatase-modifying factor enzyme-like domain-containing protein n=1 Tax=Oceanicola granulosus (strain ATCC BAA-861 / DSM 15982 / KCTC 12143 / HTCC2516) TaxID=314256 RepID=Q2CEJ4_OCEGH|nr:formylglycine-generating enzyme family protein [Oceanicola granulosus]EAR51138.1 hypothetical protein OG2516_18250 [Oceanicola granulosus HTCC2516]
MGCCPSRLPAGPAGAARPVRSAEIVEIADATPPGQAAFAGGRSHVGTRRPEIPEDGEGPVRPVRLRPFRCDSFPVTNARFAAFVAATGYVTVAERFGWGQVFAGLMNPAEAAAARAFPGTPWWRAVPGACWHAPEGPGSGITGRASHPAVHVGWDDARAFATWAGGRLPSEAEWEHAARGGLDQARFPWGDREPDDTGFLPCNIWQGRFPDHDTAADGHAGTSPVGAYPANGAGLHDMAGNVWEWTADPFRVRSAKSAAAARNAHARQENQRVTKGGSFLCHISYCYRYRIAARSGTAADSGASNTGMRVFYDG